MSTAIFVYLILTLTFSVSLSIALSESPRFDEKISAISIIFCTIFWPIFLIAIGILSAIDIYRDYLSKQANKIFNKYHFGATKTDTFMTLLSEASDKDLKIILRAADKKVISINDKHIDLLKKEIQNRKFEKEVLDG
jgi:hypothetical protein